VKNSQGKQVHAYKRETKKRDKNIVRMHWKMKDSAGKNSKDFWNDGEFKAKT
jgi:hypothetical protein